jgi:hypothetical protein
MIAHYGSQLSLYFFTPFTSTMLTRQDVDQDPVDTLTIPEYITKVQTSKKRRKKYFNKYDGKGVSRSYSYDDLDGKYKPLQEHYEGPPYNLPISKSNALKLHEGDYSWNSQGYLEDGNGDRVVANPRAAGTPNYEKLSGNRFSSGFGNHHLRRRLTHGLKDFYRPIVRNQLEPFDDDVYPLWVRWECYTVISRNVFDLDNFWFYWKYLSDVLAEDEDPNDGSSLDPIIPDDNFEYFTAPARPILYPIDDWDDRKFVFQFYRDTRDIITNQSPWNEHNQHGSADTTH